ncbi:MAG: hypothetical protein NC344_00275 [Bacteroidales bacterium]|nr:hypothetical protein [Bacteroidales bacterium]MCM1146273.1 hypothetical protein [Bacteroidales bacterium]MCM1205289.1 hypothetical protein [Bacillota bacterium]MCM1509624.1 hypothetical protein [Clostridium sp.]
MKRILSIMAVLAIVSGTAFSQQINGRDFGIDGFAAYEGTAGTQWYHAGGTTGGQGGKVVYAGSFSELQAYLQSSKPYIILVDKDITTGMKCYVDDINSGHLLDDQSGAAGQETTYGERIMIADNKTLIGIVNPQTGKAPLFSRITFVMQGVHNVIIRNCRFTMVGAPILKSGENKIVAWRNGAQVEVGDPDCIGIQADAVSAKTNGGSHVWIDHCEFFNGNAANKDRYDGLVDCKNNIQWLTISYNYFHDHDKACLWGKGDSDVFDNCRTISAHHNYFHNIDGSRLPLQRGGNVHYMNNYMNNCADGWDLRTSSVGYADASYFKDSKAPILPDGGGILKINTTEGYGIVYDNCRRVIKGAGVTFVNAPAKYDKEFTSGTNGTWTPADTWKGYFVNSYDKAMDVPGICEKYSGAGKIEIWKTYADAVPASDKDEYITAVNSQRSYQTSTGTHTEKVYDENGNTVTPSGTSQPDDPSQEAAQINFPTSTDGITVSGTTTMNSGSISLKNGFYSSSAGADNGVILKIAGGFKAGDIVTIAGTIKVADGKRATAVLAKATAGQQATAVDEEIHKFEDFTATAADQTYTLTKDYDELWIVRDGNTTATLTKIIVSRPTSIDGIETTMLGTGAMYDISGRKIAGPTKGQLYIKDGKKHVAK